MDAIAHTKKQSKKRNRKTLFFVLLSMLICTVSGIAFFSDSVADNLHVTIGSAEAVDYDYTLTASINNTTEITVNSPEEEILISVTEKNTDSQDLFRNANIIAKWSKGTDIKRATFQDNNGSALTNITYDEENEQIIIPLSDGEKIASGKTINHYIKVVLDEGNSEDDTILNETLTFAVQSDISLVRDSWAETVGPIKLKLHTNIVLPKYTVKFHANSGSGSMEDQAFVYGTAQNLRANSFTKTGYIFQGWASSADGAIQYTDKQSVNKLTSTDGAIIDLYAIWKPITYTVTYNANGGSGTMSSQSFTYDITQALTSNSFSRTGYTFQGWATSASSTVKYTNQQSVNNLTATNNGTVNLYAVWKANTYTVKFNVNGGTGSMSNQSFTYDSAQTLTANAFTRTGYTFQGWATSASGTVKYTNQQSVSNLTATNGGTVNLYAVWKVNTYSIKFNANGGTGSMSNLSMTYGTAKNLTANAFTRTGYSFSGWATTASGSVKYADKASVNNLTTTNNGTYNLYAVWSPNEPIMQSWNANATSDFHANKSKITSVTFQNTYSLPSTATAGPWDVSAAKDSSVMAYQINNALYICSNVGSSAKVIANPNSATVFYDFKALTTVNNTSNLDTSRATTVANMFTNCSVLSSLDVSTWNTSKVTNFAGFLSNCSALATLTGEENLDTSKAVTLNSMFYYCTSLPSLNISGWNVSSVNNMGYTFRNCSALTALDVASWNTSNVTYMASTFAGLTLSSLNLSEWDVSKVENFWGTFFYSQSLTTIGDVSDWNTSSATYMHSMFQYCRALTSVNVSSWDISNVTSIGSMFEGCYVLTGLNVANWDTAKVTEMNSVFANCRALTTLSISNWNVSSVTNMSRMFLRTEKITSYDLSNWNCNNVLYNEEMFWANPNLTTLVIPASMNHFENGFAALCYSLKTITFKHGASDTVTFESSPGYIDDDSDGTLDTGDTYGAFFYYEGYNYSTTVYTNNTIIKAYDWTSDCRKATFKTP